MQSVRQEEELSLSHSREEAELIESMLTNNKVDVLYSALQESETAMEIEQIKTVHTLFDYLKKDYIDGMRLDYDEIRETFAQRANPLLGEVEEDKAILEEIIDTFLTRMILNLLTQDKVAFKVQDDMVRALEELYDHREKPIIIERSSGGTSKENKKRKKEKEPVLGVKKDFAHYDRRNKEIADRCIAQRDPLTDEIEIHYSKAKKRGRHQKIRNEVIINTVEAMAGELIEKRQTLNHTHSQSAKKASADGGGGGGGTSPSDSSDISSPSSASMMIQGQKASTIDYYPIFKETLEVFNRCIPKAKNHGFYLQRLIQFIRTLDSHVWPLHGLMALANNLNYCVCASTVKLSFDRNVKRFYSCYSGLDLQDGQTVTCLRVVENDALRLKEWRDNPPSNRKPFETPEFTRSIGVFYLEKELCCPATLFFTEFSDRYKAHFPDCFDEGTTIGGTVVPSTTPTTAATTTKRKRVAPVKTKPSKKVKMEALGVATSETRCDDACLFDSLRPFDTKNDKCMLRVVMRHIHTGLEDHLASEEKQTAIWYAYTLKEQYKRNYVDERAQITGLLGGVTKKSFNANMKQLAFYTVISTPSLASVDDETTQLKLTDVCIDAMLDFIEAVVVPERKFPLFAASQKSRMMRAFVHHTEERIKRRKGPNPFLVGEKNNNSINLEECVKEMTNIHWLMCSPLLFIILFGHLAKEDATGLLRQTNTESYNCRALFKELELTLL